MIKLTKSRKYNFHIFFSSNDLENCFKLLIKFLKQKLRTFKLTKILSNLKIIRIRIEHTQKTLGLFRIAIIFIPVHGWVCVCGDITVCLVNWISVNVLLTKYRRIKVPPWVLSTRLVSKYLISKASQARGVKIFTILENNSSI